MRDGLVKPYPLADDLLAPVRGVQMPRVPRLIAPGGIVHVVSRCNNREFYITTVDDFAALLAHLHELCRTYDAVLYAYTLMANHVYLLLQAPNTDVLGQPLRWFMTQTAKMFRRVRHRRDFWERRNRACLVENNVYALAALRYLDRNPVRSGLVEDPAAYPWSTCGAYARRATNPLVTFHSSYLALSPHAAVRQRHYRRLLEPSEDPPADTQDPRWTTRRAVGSPAFSSISRASAWPAQI